MRWALALVSAWAGVLIGMALFAAPNAFAVLSTADAGRLVARLFAQEAYLSLGLASLLLVIVRRRDAAVDRRAVFNVEIGLLLGTIFCIVSGSVVLQPMMAAARLGHGAWSFAALHLGSVALFGLKGLLVLALAWRLARQ